jgi:hypothetical protein
VQNESFDLDRREEGNVAQAEAYSEGDGRDSSPGRSKSDTEGIARGRSPSPSGSVPSLTGSVDPIIAREQQQQQRSGVSRMLSASRKKDFAPGADNKIYELDTLQR